MANFTLQDLKLYFKQGVADSKPTSEREDESRWS